MSSPTEQRPGRVLARHYGIIRKGWHDIDDPFIQGIFLFGAAVIFITIGVSIAGAYGVV